MSENAKSGEQVPQNLFLKVYSWIKQPIVIFPLGIIVTFIFIIWVAHFPSMIYNSKYYKIYSESGPIGDTLGGIMGPPIAIFGVILTFFAFYIVLGKR